MEVLIFIVVLVVLIVVHEFGHLVAAKLSGMRVDEFGIGYPPRALTFAQWGETAFTLNWLPFGGFVKIYGEDADAHGARAFSSRPRLLQALVLVAGVAMNLLFAYVLIAGALIAGTPRAIAPEEIAQAKDVTLTVARVVPGSPAEKAKLEPGDSIVGARDAQGSWSAVDPQSFTQFISASRGEAVMLSVKRGGTTLALHAAPAQGVATADPSRYALGVEVGTTGIISLPAGKALLEGATLTWGATKLTALGLAHFFAGIFTLHADLAQVSGPVGIAGAVGDASATGFGDLLSLVALISINLALINLIPVPALDGGRLLFVLVESVTRRPITARVAQAVNGVGFALLVLLMAVITVHDIIRLV